MTQLEKDNYKIKEIETNEEIKINNKDHFESSKMNNENDDFSSIKKQSPMHGFTKINTYRSDSTGINISTIDIDHSISMENFVEFPEAQGDSKERDCQRLCSKESCQIF